MIFCVVVVVEKRVTVTPSLAIRNFVKFHSMVVPSWDGALLFSHAKSGDVFSPFTFVGANTGNVNFW